MHYRPEIDGLRAVAVLPVILFHAGLETFSGGFVGVDIFFVISGYLITSIILSEMDKGTFTIVNFYERRARRILPALFLMMSATVLFAYIILLPAELVEYSRSLITAIFFSSNILFWQGESYFNTVNELKPLLHTWSLAVEEQYYIFFPPIMMILYRFGKPAITAAIYIGIASSFALTIWAIDNSKISLEAVFYLLPTRAWEILAGAACAIALKNHLFSGNNIASILGLLMVTSAIVFLDGSVPFPSEYALLPVLGTVLIILFARDQNIAQRLLSTKAFVWIGLISYSAYLWHQPIFAFIRLSPLTAQNPLILVVGIVIVFPLAFLSYKYVEAPFRKAPPNTLGSKAILALPITVTCLLMIFWLAAEYTNGFPGRYPERDKSLALLNVRSEGEYTIKYFDVLNLEPFDSDKASKVLIVGDSFGKDFLNSIIEVNRHQNTSVSTFHILQACGNLDVDIKRIAKNLNQKDKIACAQQERYENPVLQQRLKEADYVILASSWREWQGSLLPESLSNLTAQTTAKIAVLGRKHFGDIEIKRYLEMPLKERIELRNQLPALHLSTNNTIGKLIHNNFIDFQAIVCEDKSTCPIFTKTGKLISYDGTHLTPDGARYAGNRLFQKSTFINEAFPQ
ncbi:acyltransferase family protein [Kordiimonas aquimaris]|uniref:acyltransferase family protein n=1 Tax=Kordiimonas aquimaris TaxID=707591 RepID=UPI0021D310A6|nr:acyltransferase family protein [Kordiimonas aquimaris]